uniref:Uncharacterized protein n=1 Tax=Oryza brachyantha TaxID=4533 RepID=J3LWN6_ORYBR
MAKAGWTRAMAETGGHGQWRRRAACKACTYVRETGRMRISGVRKCGAATRRRRVRHVDTRDMESWRRHAWHVSAEGMSNVQRLRSLYEWDTL